jgi:hypothetical protein
MSRLARVGLWCAACIVCAGVGIFLVSQGLSRAVLWATVVGLPIALVGAAATIWTALLTARTIRETRQDNGQAERNGAESSEVTPQEDARVDLIDASVDNKIKVDLSSTPRPSKDQADDYQISDVKFDYQAIDFKFINHGNVSAVLHQFTTEILDFQLDVTPVLACSTQVPFSARLEQLSLSGHEEGIVPLQSATIKIDNHGWGDAIEFSGHLRNHILISLFPDAKLHLYSPTVTSGGSTTLTLSTSDIEHQRIPDLIARRKAILTRTVAAAESTDPTIMDDSEFTTLMTYDERRLVELYFERLQWDKEYKRSSAARHYRDQIVALDCGHDALPIDLEMNMNFLDQRNREYSVQKRPSLSIDSAQHLGGSIWHRREERLRVAGLGIGTDGLYYTAYYPPPPSPARTMPSREIYAVVLDPRASRIHNYSISRVIPPGGADRFHVLVAARQSGNFVLKLTFQVNRSQFVKSDPISISVDQPRDSDLRLSVLEDGASFELHDGRLILGGPSSRRW